ncbi:DUF350 domain-containing protein [Rhodobacterales bacterium HKCCE3408]|nr:DUF350 domain-containing protein [Rhodobacterales bacterium HKCCE3408]
MFDAILISEVISTIFYTALGGIMLWVSWKVIDWLTPFPVVKEIEEDHNMALAILIAAIFIAMAIIIAAVILS